MQSRSTSPSKSTMDKNRPKPEGYKYNPPKVTKEIYQPRTVPVPKPRPAFVPSYIPVVRTSTSSYKAPMSDEKRRKIEAAKVQPSTFSTAVNYISSPVKYLTSMFMMEPPKKPTKKVYKTSYSPEDRADSAPVMKAVDIKDEPKPDLEHLVEPKSQILDTKPLSQFYEENCESPPRTMLHRQNHMFHRQNHMSWKVENRDSLLSPKSPQASRDRRSKTDNTHISEVLIANVGDKYAYRVRSKYPQQPLPVKTKKDPRRIYTKVEKKNRVKEMTTATKPDAARKRPPSYVVKSKKDDIVSPQLEQPAESPVTNTLSAESDVPRVTSCSGGLQSLSQQLLDKQWNSECTGSHQNDHLSHTQQNALSSLRKTVSPSQLVEEAFSSGPDYGQSMVNNAFLHTAPGEFNSDNLVHAVDRKSMNQSLATIQLLAQIVNRPTEIIPETDHGKRENVFDIIVSPSPKPQKKKRPRSRSLSPTKRQESFPKKENLPKKIVEDNPQENKSNSNQNTSTLPPLALPSPNKPLLDVQSPPKLNQSESPPRNPSVEKNEKPAKLYKITSKRNNKLPDTKREKPSSPLERKEIQNPPPAPESHGVTEAQKQKAKWVPLHLLNSDKNVVFWNEKKKTKVAEQPSAQIERSTSSKERVESIAKSAAAAVVGMAYRAASQIREKREKEEKANVLQAMEKSATAQQMLSPDSKDPMKAVQQPQAFESKDKPGAVQIPNTKRNLEPVTSREHASRLRYRKSLNQTRKNYAFIGPTRTKSPSSYTPKTPSAQNSQSRGNAAASFASAAGAGALATAAAVDGNKVPSEQTQSSAPQDKKWEERCNCWVNYNSLNPMLRVAASTMMGEIP